MSVYTEPSAPEGGFALTPNNRKGSQPILRWTRATVGELFEADLRSLAAFRIVLAVLVLADLANRASDLYAHYTDYGILPRAVLLEEVLNRWGASLNLMNGEPFFQTLLFGVAALAALGLLVGYRTRLMTITVWVLLLSMQLRNPLLGAGGEVLLRMLLFWGMFLPLGAYWSVDRARKVTAPRLSMRFLSMATVGLFMQIAFTYWFTAILKSGGQEWSVDGTALYYALSIDELATPIGAYLYQFPALLKVLTFATLGLEAFGPLLLLFFTGPVRTGAIVAFMSFHFGIWLTMHLGNFPWISAFCMVCFLPSWFWNKVAAKLHNGFSEEPPSAERSPQRAGERRTLHAYWSNLWARFSALMRVGHPSSVGTAPDGGKAQPAATAAAERETQRGAAAGDKPTMLQSSLATNLLAFFSCSTSSSGTSRMSLSSRCQSALFLSVTFSASSSTGPPIVYRSNNYENCCSTEDLCMTASCFG